MLTRRLAPYAFLALAALLAIAQIFALEISSTLHFGHITHNLSPKSYNYVVLLSNYFTEGFVHRGLQGSIFYIFRNFDQETSLILFHLFNIVWLCVPLVILLRGLTRLPGQAWLWPSLVLAFSPQLFVAWGRDIGRADMLAAGFVAWALLACLDHRYIVAVVIVFIASQGHEIGLIYGGPLCVAAGFLDYRAGKVRLGRIAIALSLLGVLWVLALAAQRLFGASASAIARDMLSRAPAPKEVAYSPIYMTVGGLRTLKTSACMIFSRPTGYLNLVGAFVVLAIYGFILPAASRLRVALLLFVGFLPMAVLSVLAVDYGRWLCLAVFNWWLINAALQLKGVDGPRLDPSPPRPAILAAAAILVMGPASFSAPSAMIAVTGNHLWPIPASENPLDLLYRCDPNWRSVVIGAPAPRR